MRKVLISTLNWHPKVPFYYGWLVMATAALGAFVGTGVAQTVLGGVQDLIADDMGWNRTTIAFAATAGTWISGITMPFVGKLVDKYGPRGMMPIAVIIVSLGFFAISGVQSLWQFYVAYILTRAIAGPNLQNVVPRTIAVNFFRRRRNLALGITALNRPGTEALNIQIITLISGSFGWRVAYRYLGLFALPLTIPLLLIMRKGPEEVGQHPDGDPVPVTDSRDTTSVSNTAESPMFSWRTREVLALPTFWFIVSGEFLAVSTTGAVAFQIVPFLSDSGVSPTVAAVALTLSVLFGGLSGPLWGYFSDRFTVKTLFIFGLASTMAVTGVLLAIDLRSIGFYVVLVWGISSGGLNVLGSMMVGHYFGRSSFGAITGLTGPFRTAAMGLGPTLGATLFNLTGGYTTLFVFAIVSYGVSIVLNYSVRTPELPQRAFQSDLGGTA